MKHNQAQFRALGNMGDALIKMDDLAEAVAVYQRQVRVFRDSLRDNPYLIPY